MNTWASACKRPGDPSNWGLKSHLGTGGTQQGEDGPALGDSFLTSRRLCTNTASVLSMLGPEKEEGII